MTDAILARLSNLVYEDWDVVRDGLRGTSMTLVRTFDHSFSEAMLVEGVPNHGTALVFRGTQWRAEILDLMANIVGWPSPWDGAGRVHAGYGRQLNRIKLDVWTLYRCLHDNGLPPVVTGHSMGGALATVFAALAGYRDCPASALVTFGAPKAVSRTAARTIRCPIRRYAVRGDFAPYWPPMPGLAHPAPAISLPAPAKGRWSPLPYHDVEHYIACLET